MAAAPKDGYPAIVRPPQFLRRPLRRQPTRSRCELLVKPVERDDEVLRQQYERALSASVVLVLFDRDAARLYAGIRRDRALRAPDAIQLAYAATARTDLFITNDDRLSRCAVPGIQFITSLERAFL